MGGPTGASCSSDTFGGVARRGFLLLHGGELGGWCWERVQPLLALPSVAVDLRPVEPTAPVRVELTLGDYVTNARRQLEDAAFDETIVVAHSLGGITAV